MLAPTAIALLALASLSAASCNVFRNTSDYYFQSGPEQRASDFFNCTTEVAAQTVVGTDCDTSHSANTPAACAFYWGSMVHGNSSNNVSLSAGDAAPLYDLVRKSNKPPGRQTFPQNLTFDVISGPEVHLGFFSTCLFPGQHGYQVFTPKQLCINGTVSQCDSNGPVEDGTYISLCGVGTMASGARVDGDFNFVATTEGTSFPGGNNF